MHTEGHDPGRPEGTSPHRSPVRNAENPGYEVTDVNVSGIIVFLSGLIGFVLVFFVFCFGMGKVINNGLLKEWGEPTKWNQRSSFQGTAATGKRENLVSNTELQQRELQQVAAGFPAPRLESDDGLQDTADLHAREDLLLNHYSTIDNEPNTYRIPISRALELVAQRGLPMAPASQATSTAMTGDVTSTMQAPLTDGFARTGFELEKIEERKQKLQLTLPEGENKAEAK